MFENLKAFIRHGKQANDLKKKPTTSINDLNTSPLSTEFSNNLKTSSDFTNNENPFGSNYEIIDSYNPSDKQYQQYQEEYAQQLQQQQGQVQPQPQNQGIYNNSTDAFTNQNFSDVTLNESTHTNQEQDYNKLAAQMVEEENKQKQKSKNKKYPNLDNYKVMEQMGEGAFSVVYKAINLKTNKEVAIKILRKFQMDQQQKQAVLKEVTIMRQLNHSNVVKFIEFIDSPVYYYIVQELVSGGEIFTMIVKYTYLSEDLSRWIIKQVALAIRYLHEEVGIVHRDIKPENLLFEPIEFKPSNNPISKLRKSDDPNSKKDEGEFFNGIGGGGIGIVKLADFGLSKQIWEHNTKTPCGTVGYTAPEIVRDERYSKEVDMWAIGCVLYTLLCGFPPFYDERIETLTEKVAKGQFTFLQPWWDEISQDAKNCVNNLLTVDPKRRYTIDEFLQDPWMNKESSTATLSQKPSIPEHVKKSHPIQSANNGSTGSTNSTKYSKKFKAQSTHQDLYSPAAVALRDAFDISTAVHRMGEEAALSRHGNNQPNIEDLIEEEEEENEEDISGSGRVLKHHQRSNNNYQNNQSSRVPRSTGAGGRRHHQQQQIFNKVNNGFDLNLGGASIIERRKNKQIPIQSS
ncbi:srk1 [Candida pseudojiufengensis]|uniref:srk1 n=1 Tax=Candida pseudojiufengensis TaxID=497109 RepID=UPI0022244ABE|nr:srk1 [Candida pseudojiufengensis]KAI5965303.1 srk1 [Candida pseudojiufengensis]